MASLSLRCGWPQNGCASAVSSSSSDQHSHGCVSQFFPRKLVNKRKNLLILTDHKPHHQQTAQSHRWSSVAAVTANWPAGGNGRVNRTSNEYSSRFDYLIRNSDRDYCADDWTEVISNFATKKRIVDKEEESSKKLDRWMRDSVVEIVNNIGEAPFLVHIYSEDEDEDEDEDKSRKESSCSSSNKKSSTRLVKEKADAESWPAIKGRWDGGKSPIPNGVILVEELKPKQVADKPFDFDDDDDDDDEGIDDDDNNNSQVQTTKIWGVLIQAKGLNCTACYILKTCRVQNFWGFCTHFCLLRVECFVDNAETQLKKLWLQI